MLRVIVPDANPLHMNIEGQLNDAERSLLTEAILNAPTKPEVVLEVGTWLGGGSTIHVLRALEANGEGHLWGIEADQSIYDRMVANIRSAAPECMNRFTPLFGESEDVIPKWLAEQKRTLQIDLTFLDGGNNPGEQIREFQLLQEYIPVGGQLMSHDAKMRKGKWLVPYLSLLDNWRVQFCPASEVGLMLARKISPHPSPGSRAAANARLFKMRCNPIEIAASILPSKVCGLLLELLPPRVAHRLSDGAH
jgi:predicted O-methyltransferase YrrM